MLLIKLAESGIRTRADIEMLEACGYDGFLVGEVLVREEDPGGKLGELLDSNDRGLTHKKHNDTISERNK